MQQLLQGAEGALKLAKHAETWEWKKVETGDVKDVGGAGGV